MRNIINIVMATTLLFAGGCASNTKCIGKVGNMEFWKVRANSFSGPNIAALVTKEGDTVKVQNVFAGPGLGAATISAVGHVGAAAVLGTSFPANVGDNINAFGGDAGSTSTASGSGSATGGTGQHIPPGHINNPSGNH